MRSLFLILLLAVPVQAQAPPPYRPAARSQGNYETTNFIVSAPDQSTAKQVGDYAEFYRKDRAMAWIGTPMLWQEKCPIEVQVTNSLGGGSTTQNFVGGRLVGLQMHIEGRLDKILVDVLPHEITHTVLAYYFGQPVPRWIDEGAAGNEETEDSLAMYADFAWDGFQRQKLIPLRQLFGLKQYPQGRGGEFYSQSVWVTNYLFEKADRSAMLRFIRDGMTGDWDGALQKNFGFRTVEELQQDWTVNCLKLRKRLRGIRGTKPSQPSTPAPSVVQGSPGPAGQQGPAGKDGANGKDGQAGKDAVIDYQKVADAVLLRIDYQKIADAVVLRLPQGSEQYRLVPKK